VDGVVTVVDAANGPDTLDQQFEAVSQVAMADLLVLSKSDLVTQQALAAFESRLRDLNQTARIIKAERGLIPVASLWGLSGMRRAVDASNVMEWLTPVQAAVPFDNLSGFAAPSASAPMMQTHQHDARIGSASIVLDAPIPAEAFDLWLDTLVRLRGSDLLRVKGIVHLEDVPTPFVFHGVQHLFDPPVPLRDWPKDDQQSRIVVIARDMTNPELNRSLDMLRARRDGPERQAG